MDKGFHDVTLIDMSHIDGPEVPVADDVTDVAGAGHLSSVVCRSSLVCLIYSLSWNDNTVHANNAFVGLVGFVGFVNVL